MGKLYVPSKPHTPVDAIRNRLEQADQIVSRRNPTPSQAFELLHLLDEIGAQLEELEAQEVDVRVERARFETVQKELKRCKGRFISPTTGTLEEERTRVDSARSRWWWYLPEVAKEERRRRWLRLAKWAAVAVLALGALWVVYDRFLAPPPEKRQAYRHLEAGRSEVANGQLRAAVAEFTAATELTPDDPEGWLWRGVIHDELGNDEQTETAYAAAEQLYATLHEFLLNRGRVYLQAGNLEQAKADVKAAIDEDATSGWGYYLRAGIAVREGDRDAALADLERAAELAAVNESDDLAAMVATQRSQLLQMWDPATPE